MLQILLVVMGILVIAKGKEIKASKTKVVPAQTAKGIGIAWLVAAAIPFILPSPLSLFVMLGIAAIATVIGIAKAKPVECNETEKKDVAAPK